VIALAMLGWVALRNAEADRAVANSPYREIRSVVAQEDRRPLEALLDQAYGVLRSGAMQQNLSRLAGRYPEVYASPGRPAMPMSKVADIIVLRARGARYVPADVALAETDELWGGGVAGYASQGPGEGRYSDIVLSRHVLDAWRSGDLVERSCAINVAAHEYSHTISTLPFVYQTAFTDTGAPGQRIGRRDRSLPVASYLLGTVAQCTWLQLHGRISPSEVPACVEVFGVSSGNLHRCGAFSRGQPIIERPGLPPKSDPL
jgi:hypothetical protein